MAVRGNDNPRAAARDSKGILFWPFADLLPTPQENHLPYCDHPPSKCFIWPHHSHLLINPFATIGMVHGNQL